MRRVSVGLVVGMAACSGNHEPPLAGSHHVDAASIVDAPPDAKTCTDVNCDVTVDCAGNVSHLPVPLCLDGDSGPTFEGKAKTVAMGKVDCTQGATFTATCTAVPSAYTCPNGFELENTTVCLPDKPYDADTSDVCAHLPTGEGACSVGCDRASLYAFATNNTFQVYFCTSTDGVLFQVGAAPMTGDGSR